MDLTVEKAYTLEKENDCPSAIQTLKQSWVQVSPSPTVLFKDPSVFSSFVIPSASSCNFDEEKPC